MPADIDPRECMKNAKTKRRENKSERNLCYAHWKPLERILGSQQNWNSPSSNTKTNESRSECNLVRMEGTKNPLNLWHHKAEICVMNFSRSSCRQKDELIIVFMSYLLTSFSQTSSARYIRESHKLPDT